MKTALGYYDDIQVQRIPAPTKRADRQRSIRDAKRRFDRLVTPYWSDLNRYALWLSRNPDLAQEIVQETMLRAWRALESLRDENLVKNWLFTIARREHARYYERKRVPLMDIDCLTADEKLQASTCEDEDVLEVRSAIANLDEKYREPLVLQVLLGFSLKEIAALLGLNVTTVGVRLHRARLILSDEIRNSEDEGH